MKPQFRQEQRLEQRITQTLLQSIQLLQFSSLELIDYIKELANENPLIKEVNYDDYDNQYKTPYSDYTIVGDINEETESMYTQLKNQLYELDVPSDLREIVEFGIDSLNNEGYLDIELELWAKKCQTTTRIAEDALFFIQSLEPKGIGARNLAECLYLQLKDKINWPYLQPLLNNHLALIADNNVEAIKKYYDINEQNIITIIDHIKICHPHPGLLLETEKPEYILPEANVIKKAGNWEISFYKSSHPSIVVDETYKNLLDINSEATTYIKEKYKQIDWLNQAMSYRTNTLELVLKMIISKQYLYFEHDVFMLKPLTLKEVSESLAVNISTVSRTVSNKYIQTPYGVVPLKFFFQSGLRQESGQSISTYAVKKLIVEAINFEDKFKPLSDEAIKNQLNKEFGVNIARRTVMKYRGQLNIPSSTKRK